MPQWMQDLTAGWPMIRANLPTFFVILVLMVSVVWIVVNWSYSGELASKNGQIELKDRQLADYRDKLKGATPEEAKAKIDALERTVNLTIGRRWDPLTKPEIAALAVNLTSVPKIRVQIMYENALGKDLAQSFYDAFKQAGWDDASFGPGSGLGHGVTTGQGPTSAVALKSAIEKSSKLKGPEDRSTRVAGVYLLSSRDQLSLTPLKQPTLRLLPDPLQRIGLFLKSENRIDFPAAPHDAYGMSLPDCVLPDNELIFMFFRILALFFWLGIAVGLLPRRAMSMIDLASWLWSLGRLGRVPVICLPQSSACQRSLVEVRPTIPVCTLVGSVGLYVRLGLPGASNPWRNLATRQILRGLMVVQVPSGEYPPAFRLDV